MNIRNILASKSSLAVITAAGFLAAFSDPLQALALSTYTMVGNYIMTGTLQVGSLSTGGCVTASASGKLSTTGLICGSGGGGVATVTGSGNILSSGGFNPNITTVNAPTFSGTVTGQTFASTAMGAGPPIATWTDSIGFPVTLTANQLQNTANVLNLAFGLHTGFGNTNLLSIDDNGNMGIAGNMFIGAIPHNECVQTNNNGELVGTGSACSGGGGVTSVTSSTPLALTASPTTGAVVIAIPNSPLFSGTTQVTNLVATGSVQGAQIGATNLIGHSGECLQASGGANVIPTGSPCGGGQTFEPIFSATNGYYFNAVGNGPLSPDGPYNGNQLFVVPVGITIGHINVACNAFNAADAAAFPGNPYSTLAADGLGGGTIDFGIVNATHSGTAPLNLGSVIIPTSPQAGPWVTSVTSAVGSPYTTQAGDGIVAIISAADATAQVVSACVPQVGP